MSGEITTAHEGAENYQKHARNYVEQEGPNRGAIADKGIARVGAEWEAGERQRLEDWNIKGQGEDPSDPELKRFIAKEGNQEGEEAMFRTVLKESEEHGDTEKGDLTPGLQFDKEMRFQQAARERDEEIAKESGEGK